MWASVVINIIITVLIIIMIVLIIKIIIIIIIIIIIRVLILFIIRSNVIFWLTKLFIAYIILAITSVYSIFKFSPSVRRSPELGSDLGHRSVGKGLSLRRDGLNLQISADLLI